MAVIGGGLAGCCTAAELAVRGCRVTIYEREGALLTRAASANEGKLHLGYVYAGDPSLATARMMITGALSFGPHIARLLGTACPDLNISSPFLYAVHRQSQLSAERIERHLAATHDLIAEYQTDPHAYLGCDLGTPPHRLSDGELEDRFDPREVVAAFATPERAIDPLALARLLTERIEGDPAIELRTGATVTDIADDDPARLKVAFSAAGEACSEAYDYVVNASWENRLALDARRGLEPRRQWFHRYKYGMRLTPAEIPACPSVTLVLGAFGDVVAYRSGAIYISWYPACLAATSRALQPAYRPTRPDEEEAETVTSETLAALRAIVPALRSTDLSRCKVEVRGGQIVAWAETDIHDRKSGLHSRSMIGVEPSPRYFSIDPGKLTTAPHFAHICADRIASS